MERYSPNAGIPREEMGRAVTQSNTLPSYYSPGAGNLINYPSPESTQHPGTRYTDIYRSYNSDLPSFRYPPPTSNGRSPASPNMYQPLTSNQYPQQSPSTQYPSQALNQYPSPISNQYQSSISNLYTPPSIQYHPTPSTQYPPLPSNQHPQVSSNQYPTPSSNQYPPMGSQSQFPTSFERDSTWNPAGWSQYQEQRQQSQFQMAPSPAIAPKVDPVPPPNLLQVNCHPNIVESKASPPLPIVETDRETTTVEEQEVKTPVKKPVILVGKRRGGKVLPTGNLGVSKKPRLENEKGRSDAWSRYMAEVKLYKDRSCEEDRKNRPLVK